MRLQHPDVQLLLDEGFAKVAPSLPSELVLRSAVKGPGDVGVRSDSLLVIAAPLIASLLFKHVSRNVDPANLPARPTDAGCVPIYSACCIDGACIAGVELLIKEEPGRI